MKGSNQAVPFVPPEDFVERLESRFARKWRRWSFEQSLSGSAAA
jgi:hypothetical protein